MKQKREPRRRRRRRKAQSSPNKIEHGQHSEVKFSQFPLPNSPPHPPPQRKQADFCWQQEYTRPEIRSDCFHSGGQAIKTGWCKHSNCRSGKRGLFIYIRQMPRAFSSLWRKKLKPNRQSHTHNKRKHQKLKMVNSIKGSSRRISSSDRIKGPAKINAAPAEIRAASSILWSRQTNQSIIFTGRLPTKNCGHSEKI